MRPREARAVPRQSAQKPATFKAVSIPAPTLGLIANANLATPQPGGAHVLENFFPTATGAILRRGASLYTNIDNDPAIVSLFAYVNGNNRSMFAASETAIFDVTAASASAYLVDDEGNTLIDSDGNELVGYSLPEIDAKISGQTGGEWSVVQFATPGGIFLRGVNGYNTPFVYDGTDFSLYPTITGAGLDPTKLSFAWVFKQRIFFVEKDTLNAWYLPIDSIGGAAIKIPLGGVFTRGGSLLFGASWSLETGQGGLSEQCAFYSTEGEVAVYQGTDPNDADTWSKVGVYRTGKPLGPNASFKAGGDVVTATDVGLIPLSTALQKDFAALSPNAISAKIETVWNDEVEKRSGGNWQGLIWSSSQMGIVIPYHDANLDPVIYVVNVRTGAWGKFTGWRAKCAIVFNDRLFFGTGAGEIVEGNVTGLDMGQPFVGVYVPMFSDFGDTGRKVSGVSRLVSRSTSAPNDQITMQAEYNVSLPAAPDALPIAGDNLWGTGIWGVAKWGGAPVKSTFGTWRSTPLNGDALAPAVQITSGNMAPLDTEIVRTDVTYQAGGVVV